MPKPERPPESRDLAGENAYLRQTVQQVIDVLENDLGCQEFVDSMGGGRIIDTLQEALDREF